MKFGPIRALNGSREIFTSRAGNRSRLSAGLKPGNRAGVPVNSGRAHMLAG
jgi:hypothetical protein